MGESSWRAQCPVQPPKAITCGSANRGARRGLNCSTQQHANTCGEDRCRGMRHQQRKSSELAQINTKHAPPASAQAEERRVRRFRESSLVEESVVEIEEQTPELEGFGTIEGGDGRQDQTTLISAITLARYSPSGNAAGTG